MSLRLEDLKPGMILYRPETPEAYERIFRITAVLSYGATGLALVLNNGRFHATETDGCVVKTCLDSYTLIYTPPEAGPTPEAA